MTGARPHAYRLRHRRRVQRLAARARRRSAAGRSPPTRRVHIAGSIVTPSIPSRSRSTIRRHSSSVSAETHRSSTGAPIDLAASRNASRSSRDHTPHSMTTWFPARSRSRDNVGRVIESRRRPLTHASMHHRPRRRPFSGPTPGSVTGWQASVWCERGYGTLRWQRRANGRSRAADTTHQNDHGGSDASDHWARPARLPVDNAERGCRPRRSRSSRADAGRCRRS